MNTPVDDDWQQTPAWVPSRVAATVRAMRVDLHWLHANWMEVAFARDRDGNHSVVENWNAQSSRKRWGYRLWAVLGALLLAVVYPLFVVGLATRFYAHRIDRLTAGLGFVGVALLSALVWGVLTAATYVSSIAFEGFVAVGAAGVVATVAAVLALLFTQRGGRKTTVGLAYPLGVTALFLPPVVASLYSPTLASVVFPSSTSLAIWLLDNVLDVAGIAAFIRNTFELQGFAYVGMWFVLAIPTGWALGLLTTLVDRVRTPDDPDLDERGSKLYR
ncbi:hypothetical protein C455_09993 [Haloferax larsenii JCM 13917]|nr:hypothetical protein [Haloferax larsenii]ELZ78006.1 hypothetical protein C455_09993 [Haloferax larsenii JCM 13917]